MVTVLLGTVFAVVLTRTDVRELEVVLLHERAEDALQHAEVLLAPASASRPADARPVARDGRVARSPDLKVRHVPLHHGVLV